MMARYLQVLLYIEAGSRLLSTWLKKQYMRQVCTQDCLHQGLWLMC